MRKYLTKLFSLFDRQAKWRIAGLFCLMVLGAFMEMVGIGLILPLLQLITTPGKVAGMPFIAEFYAGPGGGEPGRALILGAAILVAFYALKNAAIALLIFVQNRFVFHKTALFATDLLNSYANQPYAFHLRRNTAEFIRNVMMSVKVVFNAGLLAFLNLVMESLLVAGAVVVLLVVAPVATLFALVLIGTTMGGFYLWLRNRIVAWGRLLQDKRGKMILDINQCLGALKETKILGRSGYFVASFFSHSRESAACGTKLVTTQQFPRLLGEIVILGSLLAVVVVIVLQGKQVIEALPVLGVFAAAAMRILPSVNRIVQNAGNMRLSVAALDDVHSDYHMVARDEGTTAPSSGTLSFRGTIRLEDLDYIYEGTERPSLKGVDITIAKGEIVAFVGASGAGKTTLADIILGLLEPSRGKVLIDGANAFDDLTGWQRRIGYVPQEIYLTDDTLRRNVALGLADGDIDEAKVKEAVRMAKLEDVVTGLPDGLDTVVGERGVRLSGGQRQRIGIARALYHDPDVLVFDEATSSLDSETENDIAKTIEELDGDKTLIIIAHRLSTVRKCDRLFFLKDGRVKDSGTFDELCRTNPDFRRMAQLAKPPETAAADA